MSDHTYNEDQLKFIDVINILMKWKKTILLHIFYMCTTIFAYMLLSQKSLFALFSAIIIIFVFYGINKIWRSKI